MFFNAVRRAVLSAAWQEEKSEQQVVSGIKRQCSLKFVSK